MSLSPQGYFSKDKLLLGPSHQTSIATCSRATADARMHTNKGFIDYGAQRRPRWNL